MATYTSNYQLHQWVPEDDFLRTDFNTDFQKIDTALASVLSTAKGRCWLFPGSYVGNGNSSRTFGMGQTVQAVFLSTGSSTITALRNGGTISNVAVAGNGFTISAATLNQSGKTYNYLALV